MPIQIGDVIDQKYRITRLIGKGGMGSVYQGEHILVERRVAIKVLLPAPDRGRAVARFEQEARAAGRIGNEHILDVYDIGCLPDGSHYLVAEYLDGETLRQRIERMGRLSPREAVPLVLELLDGLGAAHAAGVVHRDLKPDNVFLVRRKAGRSDFVKLIDFGVSRFEPLDASDGARMTATGAVLGTPYYLSPEQARGRREIDGRSDLFSVGVILYEMVTGEVPFQAESFNDLLFKIVLEPAAPPEQLVPDLDPAFSRIIVKALAKDPAERYQSAEELGLELVRWAADHGLALGDHSSSIRVQESEQPLASLAPAPKVVTATRLSPTEAPPGEARPGEARIAVLGPVPTPSAFGASQLAEVVRRDTGKKPRRRKALIALAIVAFIGLSMALLVVLEPAPRIPESAGHTDGTRVPSSEPGPPGVVSPSHGPAIASQARVEVTLSPQKDAGLPSAKATHSNPVSPRRAVPAAPKGPSSESLPPPAAVPSRRRRDFGY